MSRLMITLALAMLLAMSVPAMADPVRTLDWLELIPPDELKAMEEMPTVDHSGEPMAMDYTGFEPVQALDGVDARLPGYIVPVTVTEDNRISEFFLVPYFGACIHVPPPPPNQIVYVKPDEPIEMTEIWAAYWVSGTVQLEEVSNSVAQSYYTIELDTVEPWDG